MFPMVQFLVDTSRALIPGDLPDNTLVVYRDGFGYRSPEIKKAEYIEFQEYKKKYTILEPDFIVLVGLNRCITPSNRCDMVNEYLQTMTPATPKLCIDTDPFIGEPWRLWFHYSVANRGKWNITYSYAIETEWSKWFYRDVADCRLSPENIGLFLESTISDIPPYETRFVFKDVSSDDEEWYQETKAAVFEKHNTPKMLINSLLQAANRHFNMDLSYDSFRRRPEPSLLEADNTLIRVPDIGVYRFVVEENQRRMGIYNQVVGYENISE